MVKMIIAPLVISTLVVGIAKMGDAKTLGLALKNLLPVYCASLVSIALGLVIVNIFQPGVGSTSKPHDVGVETKSCQRILRWLAAIAFAILCSCYIGRELFRRNLKWLLSWKIWGVNPGRLASVGYGEFQPVANKRCRW